MKYYFFITFLCLEILLKIPFSQQHDKDCLDILPLVPGLDQMTRGIDLTQMDLFPVEPKQDLGYRKDLFELTCNKNLKWSNKWLYPGRRFSLPDQIEIEFPEPSLECSWVKINEIDSIKAYEELLSKKAKNCGYFDFGCPSGAFSLSTSYKQLQKMFEQTNSTMLWIDISQGSTPLITASTDLPQDLKLTQEFANDISNLPSDYLSNPALYETFLNNYGTHYFFRAFFSKYVFLQAFVEKGLFDFVNCFDTYCNYMMDVFHKECGQDVDLDKYLNDFSVGKFHKLATWKTHFLGGDERIQNGPFNSTETYDRWSKEAYANPWLFGGDMRLISDLISDYNIRQQVEIAIKAKIAKANLHSLK